MIAVILATLLTTSVTLPREVPEPVAPALPRAMTFTQAVDAALAYNIHVSVAEQELQRMRGVQKEMRAQAMPTLTANGVYGHIDHARELAGRVLQPAAQLNGNVIVNLPLIAPRAWGNVSEARAATQVTAAQLEATRRDVAITAAYAYLEAVSQSHVTEVLASAVANNRAHFQYAETRFRGGVGNRLDMLRADQELAVSEVQLAKAQVATLTAQENLGRMVGYAGPVDTVDDIMLPPPQTHADALATLSKRRADLRATLSELLQAQRVRRHSWLDFMPSLLATGQIFGQDPPSPTVPHFGWQVQLMLGVPLYDGGARDGRRQQRHAMESRADLMLDDQQRRAKSEVRVALLAAAQAEQALAHAERASARAAQALQLADAAYRRGLSQNLEVVDAQRQAKDMATQAVQAHNALRIAQVQLVASVGQFP